MASPLEIKLSRHRYGSSLLNGSEITLTHWYSPKAGNGVDDITESIPLQLTGSQSAVQLTINSINKMLDCARQFDENGYGDQVELMVRAGTASAWRTSPIRDGRLSVTEESVQAGLSSGDRTPATLNITRAGYFEGGTANFIPFYNGNGTANATDGINLLNCADSGGTAPALRQNYAYVNPADIQGDLPAPMTLWIRNEIDGGSALPVSKYFISAMTPHYDVISNANYYRDFSGTADATCSGGAAATYTLSTSDETDMFTANIASATTFLQLGGAPYHIIARFRNNTSLANVKFRLKFKSGTTTVWAGPQFTLPNTNIIQDLGVVNMPPGASFGWGDGNLVISGQRTTASSETIGLDFIQFFGGDYAEFTGIVNAGDHDYLYIVGRYEKIYRLNSFGNFPVMDWTANGKTALMLRPGDYNMLLILAQTSTPGTAEIGHWNKLEGSYSPRWSLPL